ncbi:MAG: glycosyltransferase family 39 protein, partial [Planctomycetota bacterium]
MTGPSAEWTVGGMKAVQTWELAILAAILLTGTLLRAAYLSERRAAPDLEHPVIDAGFHDDWARSLAFGEASSADWRRPRLHDPEFASTPYLRPPGYPYFLSAVYRLSGGSRTAALAVQMAVGMSSVLLVWAITRAWFGAGAGLLAAAGMATHWALIFFEGELHAPVLLVPLQLLFAAALFRAAQGRRVRWAAVAGAVLGVACLVRPNALLFAPAGVLWLLWRARRRAEPGSWVRPAAVLLGTTLLAIAPATLRNWRVCGELIPITSNLGINLYLGNHAGAGGQIDSNLGPVGTFATCYDYPQVVAGLERELGRELTHREVSSEFAGRAWRWIGGNLGDAVALTLRKAGYFWGPSEVAHNKEVGLERDASPLLRWLPLPFTVLLGLALLGLALHTLSWRARVSSGALDREALDREREALVLVTLLLLTWFVSVLPFFAAARYRVPVLPWLLILASLVPRVRGMRPTALGTALVIAGGLTALSWLGAPDYSPDQERWHLDRGRAHFSARELDRAQVEFEAALALAGTSSAAHYELGVLAHDRGQLDQARQHYQAVLRSQPVHFLAAFNLGTILRDAGRPLEAAQLFMQAAQADATSAVAPHAAGTLYYALGR